MSIITELSYLKTLLTVNTKDFDEINELFLNAKILRDQPGYGWDMGGGGDTEGHLIHYVPERNYYVYIHDTIGSCNYCTGRRSTDEMLARATIYRTYDDVIAAVIEQMNRVVSDGEMYKCDKDEMLRDLMSEFNPTSKNFGIGN